MVPQFSIIIPNYNFGNFLEKSIQSVINQSYQNKELIIIDGGSTDHSVEIIEKYQGDITYWVSENDKGTYDANNKGLSKVTGDYWCVLNSDDIMLPGALQTVANAIELNPSLKWIAGSEDILDENDEVTNEISPVAPKPIEGYTFLDGCWISHPCVFLSKDVIADIGFFSKWHMMDYNYWLRMEDRGYFPYLIPEKIAGLRIHSNCKSYDQVKLFQEALNIRIDFCIRKGLLMSLQVKRMIKREEEHIVRLRIAEALRQQQKRMVFELLFAFIFKYPSFIVKRWFWGIIKRIISGIKKDDPIYKSMPAKKATASWDYK